MILIKYLIIINLISSFFFSIDKYKAKNNKYRISEFFLHFLELIGGIFSILPLMYIIRHKNRKSKYFLINYLILIIWISLLYFFYFK